MCPSIELAVEKQAGADAGAEGEEDKGAHSRGGAAPLLAQGAAVRVALDENRNAVAFLEERLQRDVDPAFQIARAQHFSSRVHRSGHSDT